MTAKRKILIIEGTGYIGKFIVEATAKSNHPTFVLIRESCASDPAKAQLVENFKNSGVTLVLESLVKAIKQVDAVIATVGHGQLADEVKIITAIKEDGTVKELMVSRHVNKCNDYQRGLWDCNFILEADLQHKEPLQS